MEESESTYQMYCANLDKTNSPKLNFKSNSPITNKNLQRINRGDSKITNGQSDYLFHESKDKFKNNNNQYNKK